MRKIGVLVVVAFFAVAVGAQQAARELVYVPQKDVEERIRKAPANSIGEQELNLIERTPDHAGILLRRVLPGKAEVHTTETDIWYVIDGGCILVTGGTVVDPKPEGTGQIRGTGITGGTEWTLSKGDFMRIPNGMPHWIKKINDGELVYTVVKYAEPAK
jgi:mannose-6-phosphate isomerase-like protein (cupin superfamily)